MSKIILANQAVDPPAPTAGQTTLYAKDGATFSIDAAAQVVRLAGGIPAYSVADIDDPSPELNLVQGDNEGDLAAVYQTGGPVLLGSNYMWGTSAVGPDNPPLTVNGLTGRWTALGGKATENVFGFDADDDQDLTLRSTANADNPPTVVAQSWVVEAGRPGRYRFGIQWQFGMSAANQPFRAQVYVDGLPLGNVLEIQVANTADRPIEVAFDYVDLTAGPHTIELRYSAGGGATATIYNSFMEFWQVS